MIKQNKETSYKCRLPTVASNRISANLLHCWIRLSVTQPHMFIHKGYTVSLPTDYLHFIKLVEKILLLLAEIQDLDTREPTLCLCFSNICPLPMQQRMGYIHRYTDISPKKNNIISCTFIQYQYCISVWPAINTFFEIPFYCHLLISTFQLCPFCTDILIFYASFLETLHN